MGEDKAALNLVAQESRTELLMEKEVMTVSGDKGRAMASDSWRNNISDNMWSVQMKVEVADFRVEKKENIALAP